MQAFEAAFVSVLQLAQAHCYAQVRPKWRQPFDEEHGGRSPTGSWPNFRSWDGIHSLALAATRSGSRNCGI
jgi:hypothetical protein